MTIAFQENGTLIILINYVVSDIELLLTQKIASPCDDSHAIIHANKFSFSGTLSVDFLTGGA
jgi:hypothetical protein